MIFGFSGLSIARSTHSSEMERSSIHSLEMPAKLNHMSTVYEVLYICRSQFVTAAGKPEAVTTLTEHDVCPIDYNDLKTVRPLSNSAERFST